MLGYFCPYCDYSNSDHVNVTLHEIIKHPGLILSISIRQVKADKIDSCENSMSEESDIFVPGAHLHQLK